MFKINISEIAKLAGVSKSTVSRVLNGHADVMPETRQRIQQIIKQVDYHPKAYAKAISHQRSETVCTVLPYSPRNAFSNPYYIEVIRGIASVVQEQGYQLLLLYSGQGDYMTAAKEQRADGIVFLNPMEVDHQNIQELDKMGFPITIASRAVGLSHINCVCIDDYKASTLAIEHLVLQNHKHIAMINIPRQFASGEIRFQGYKDTLKKYGIPFRAEYVVTCEDVLIENGMYAMQKLLQIPDITAVYVTDDMMAAGAIRAISMAGKSVPENYSIVGFDDHPLSEYLNPALTTIRHDACERGRIVATMLMDKIDNKAVEDLHMMDVELIIRDSTREI